MRRRGAMSQALLILLGLVVLGIVVIAIGVGLSSAISSLFQKSYQVGVGDSGGVSGITVTKVLFVGDDVIETAAGGFKTLAEKDSGRPATINEQMRSSLNSINVNMDSAAIAGQNTQVNVDKGLTPALAQEANGFNGLVFMFSKDADTNAAKQNIDKLVSQATAQGLVVFGIKLPTVGGDANYVKEINQHLQSKDGTIKLIDATSLRPSNAADPTTIPLDNLRGLIKQAIGTWNAQPAGGRIASGPVLPVPLYDQRTKWGDNPSGGKFCGVTSVKMALDYYARLGYSGLKNLDTLNDRAYESRYVHGWLTNAAWEDHVSGGTQVSGQRLDANDWQKAKDILAAGHPIVSYGSWTFGGGHIVVIIGITADSVSYADPWEGKVRTVSKAKASNYLVATKYSYAGTPIYLYDTSYKTNRLR